MRGPHNFFRLIRTGATLERTGAMKVLLDTFEAPWSVRVVMRGLTWPIQWLGLRGDVTLPPVTRAITALGPAYVKFGQLMSTRPDVVGFTLAEQLQVLQDRMSAFPRAEAVEMVERELGLPLASMFSEFSEPVAAASIAQVHHARLASTGQEVAVKVLRPGVERAFRKDVDAFYFAAGIIEALLPSTRRLRPLDVIEHFDGVVRGELDLRLEASNASQYTENTKSDPGFQVPLINWDYSAKRVMTIDWAEGIAISDIAALDAQGQDKVALGARLLQLFLSHALRDGFFHADMHQGNVKVAANGDLIALDFGIMGQIDEYTRRVYAEIIYGFLKQDYRRVAEVHFEAGYVPADRDVAAFARALRAVGEPIAGMDASNISMSRLLSYLFEVTERFGMQTRTELILLQRTMVVVEGVARSLDPTINIWEVARPVVENYVRKSIGPAAVVRDLSRIAHVLSRAASRLPERAEDLLFHRSEVKQPPPRRSVLPLVVAVMAGVIIGLLFTN